MYRGVAWLALRRGIPPNDQGALGQLARTASLQPAPDGRGLAVNHRLLTHELRSAEVENTVSQVASVLPVRQALVEKQQEVSSKGSIVIVGRDIGTDVAPDAEVKVFLVASPQERAARRFRELEQEGETLQYDQVLRELEERDRVDSHRSHSPLRPAPDAFLIDTEGKDPNEVVDRIVALVRSSA